jgi:hypothetical protein
MRLRGVIRGIGEIVREPHACDHDVTTRLANGQVRDVRAPLPQSPGSYSKT